MSTSNPTGQLWVAAKSELSTLEKYLLVFKHHERFLIVLAVLAFGCYGTSKVLNYESAQKDAKVVALTAQVEQDRQSVAQMAISASQAQAVYQTTLDAITKQNVALAQANAQESTALAQRQAVDRALPLPAVANRIEVLVPATQGGITTTTAGVVLNDTASHSILSNLEQVPVLTDQLSKEEQIVQNDAVVLDKAQASNVALSAEVTALQVEGADAAKQCKAEVSAEKVKTKKAFLKGLKYGFVAGFAAGAYVMHIL